MTGVNAMQYLYNYIDLSNIYNFNVIALSVLLYVIIGILVTYGKHLHDPIISLREEIWAQKTSLTPQLRPEVLYKARKVSGHVFVS